VLSCGPGPQAFVLERCIFIHKKPEAILIADAYDGARIRETLTNFISSAAALREESLTVSFGNEKHVLAISGGADLILYVGHDALMDFQIPRVAGKIDPRTRQFIILACASKQYFATYMRDTLSQPLLWTTGLMAPEAYTLDAALEGWIEFEDANSIRNRAAAAYDKYQKCGPRAAQRLFASTW
jgi:hypothetical protein